MLVMVLAWLYLALVTFPVGVLLVALTGKSMQGPALRLWSGLAVQAVLLQALSAVAPLYPLALFVMPLVAALSALVRRHDLTEFMGHWQSLLSPSIVAVGILSLAIAYITTGPITYYDSGLYHIQVLRWLARDGLVPGLSLLELRFGIPSDWFALIAPFDAGPLQGRMAASANAYVVLLMAGQSLFCWARLLSRQAQSGDALLAASFGLVIAHALWTGADVSASPDLPVAAFTVVVGWLIDAEGGYGKTGTGVGCYARVVLFAATAVAVKLSASPILAIALLYSVWRLRHAPVSATALVIMAVAVLAPSVYAGILMNGCPAFPLRIGCLDLPWTVSADAARDFQEKVTLFARWYVSPQQGTGAFAWIVPYFLHPGDRVNPPLVMLALLSMAALLVPGVARRAFRYSGGWILALGLGGFAFMMITAPDTRFGIGAIALLFGTAFSAIASPWFDARPTDKHRVALRSSRGAIFLAVVGAVGLIVFRVAILDRVTLRRWEAQVYGPILPLDLQTSVADRWLLPVPLPVIYGYTRMRDGGVVRLASASSSDVNYRKPPFGDQCWGTSELCTPDPAAPLRFRRPEIGAAGGFIRVDR